LQVSYINIYYMTLNVWQLCLLPQIFAVAEES